MRTRIAVRAVTLVMAVFAVSGCQHTPPVAAAGVAAASASPAESAAVRTVTVRGAQLHYREVGTGPAVVLVHGSMGDMSDWDAQVAPLAKQYRVIVYSRRFHLPNAPLAPGGEYVMDEHAEDLAALIEALHAAPAHVVGHSYGAYTSLRMAMLHPDLVRSLVLGEPPILGWVSGTPEADSVRAAFFADALGPSHDAFVRGDSVEGMRRFIDGVTGRRGCFDAMPPAMQQEALRAATEMRGEMTTQFERMMTPITCDEVRAFPKPTLVLTADRSPRFFHIVTAKLPGCLRNVATGTVPNAGHALQVANPESFNQQVLAFLAQH